MPIEATKAKYEPSSHVEQQLYGGDFPLPADYQLMDRFHQTPWAERHKLTEQFIDPKFGFLAKRLIFANDPYHLPNADRDEIASHVSSRLIVANDADVKWTTLTKARSECATMIASANPDDLSLLQGYAQYLDFKLLVWLFSIAADRNCCSAIRVVKMNLFGFLSIVNLKQASKLPSLSKQSCSCRHSDNTRHGRPLALPRCNGTRLPIFDVALQKKR